MIEENKKVLYNKLKNTIMSRYTSPFNLVLWIKNANCDFMVRMVGKDSIYKIITNGDKFRIPKIKQYWKEKQTWTAKIDLYFIYVDSDFKTFSEPELQKL